MTEIDTCLAICQTALAVVQRNTHPLSKKEDEHFNLFMKLAATNMARRNALYESLRQDARSADLTISMDVLRDRAKIWEALTAFKTGTPIPQELQTQTIHYMERWVAIVS